MKRLVADDYRKRCYVEGDVWMVVGGIDGAPNNAATGIHDVDNHVGRYLGMDYVPCRSAVNRMFWFMRRGADNNTIGNSRSQLLSQILERTNQPNN